MDAVVVVAAIILDGTGRFLIARRKKSGAQGGLWEFPGGTVEKGETHKEALARELLEELGLRVRVGDLLLSHGHDYPEGRILVHSYYAELLGGSLRPVAHDEVRWVSTGEAAGCDLAPADVKVLKKLRDVLG